MFVTALTLTLSRRERGRSSRRTHPSAGRAFATDPTNVVYQLGELTLSEVHEKQALSPARIATT
jgi:hypothetical protein